jgi:hypothetical protein
MNPYGRLQNLGLSGPGIRRINEYYEKNIFCLGYKERV